MAEKFTINNNGQESSWVEVNKKKRSQNKGPRDQGVAGSTSTTTSSSFSSASSSSSTTQRPRNEKYTDTTNTSAGSTGKQEDKCQFHKCVPNNCPGDKRCTRLGLKHMDLFHKGCNQNSKDRSHLQKRGGSKQYRIHNRIIKDKRKK